MAKTVEQLFDEVGQGIDDPTEREDLEIAKADYRNQHALADLASSQGGQILIKELEDGIAEAIQKLIETREGRYVSELDTKLSLLTKLIGAPTQLDGIKSWIGSLNEV